MAARSCKRYRSARWRSFKVATLGDAAVIPSEAKRSRGCNAADAVREARLSIPWHYRGLLREMSRLGRHDIGALNCSLEHILLLAVTSAHGQADGNPANLDNPAQMGSPYVGP